MASNGRAHRFGDRVEQFDLGAGFEAFHGELDFGDEGPEVEHLQLLLIRAEVLAFGEDDGSFGERTVAAVKRLQQLFGIPVTGRWDELTEDATTARFGTEAPKQEDRVRYWFMRVDGTAEVFIVSEDFSFARHVPNLERKADIKQLASEADTEILNNGEDRLVSRDFMNFVLGL
jgi:peptidoglycan hydrolase-like protein with peptidoglycan-binding domain